MTPAAQPADQAGAAPWSLPALAPIGPELTPEETARYARHLSLPGFGMQAQRRLKAAKVFVVGAGGLGSPVLQYLAAAGVGTIGVIDDDVVEITNLQRQVIHTTDRIGQAKVDSAAAAIHAINPEVTVHRYQQRLNAENILPLIQDYQLVIDGTDNFGTRYLVNDACELAQKPLVWGTIFRFSAQLSVFAPPAGPTLRDLFPEIPDPDSVPSCAEGGVLGVLPGLVGTAMATEAIKLLSGIGQPAIGRVLLYDAEAMSWRSLSISRDPQRPPVTDLAEATAVCAARPAESLDDPAAQAAAGGADTSGDGDGAGSAGGIRQIPPAALAAELDAGTLLVDVRDSWERDVVAIPGAHPVPLEQITTHGWQALAPLLEGRDYTSVTLHCKSGARSQQAALALDADAHPQLPVQNLRGGVLAWAQRYAPDAPRY